MNQETEIRRFLIYGQLLPLFVFASPSDFLAMKILGFLTFLAKILAIILGKVRNLFQDRGKKSKKILGVLGNKTKNLQYLGKTIKFCIKVIQDLQIFYKQLYLKNQKEGYSCVCFYLNLNLAWPEKKETKINWNKMEAKMKQFGMKIIVQTSSVKMCDFFNLFRVYKWIDFVLEKILSMLPPPIARNLDPA